MLARRRQRLAGRWIGLGIAVLVAGCGISGEVKDAARTRRERVEVARTQIAAIERDVQGALAGPDAALFRGYDEIWERQLTEAQAVLDGADALLNERVEPLLAANERDSTPAIIDLLRAAKTETHRALTIAEAIPAQIATFRRYRDTAPELVKRAGQTVKAAEGRIQATQPIVEGAWGQYPDKKADLQKRWASVAGEDGLLSSARAAAQRAAAELSRGEPDYVQLGQSAEMADSLTTGVIPQTLDNLQDRVRQLGESYEKRLADMKTESRYQVALWISRWDPWSDFPSEREEPHREAYVDRKTFERYESWLDEGRSIVVERGGDHEVYVNDVFEEVHYYHQYEVIRGQEREVTDWIEVDQPTYRKHENDLGMALAVKLEGTYEDETIRTASPPGYGSVGNPRYGRWQQDNQGRSFWAFYGQYMFMRSMMWGMWGPGYNVYRTDWNRWDNHRRRGQPYYGGAGEYGTRGSLTRRGYASSTFGRGGGFRDRPSVRRGEARRGRGPGGRGK